MNVEEVRAQNRKISSESESEGLLLKSMRELDACSSDSTKREQAENKVRVMGEAHQHIVDGNRYKHDFKIRLASSVGAIAGGAFLLVMQDTRVVPKVIEDVMRRVGRA